MLRSQSEDPFIQQHRSIIHKIGVTGGDVKKRVANAKKDPTYLLADVEIVAEFKLINIDRTKLEALLHKFFDSARLDVKLEDRFGIPLNRSTAGLEPRRWYLPYSHRLPTPPSFPQTSPSCCPFSRSRLLPTIFQLFQPTSDLTGKRWMEG
ncbi:MAG: GIY-YIG nuclease family protein [Nodosilinea sp.]